MSSGSALAPTLVQTSTRKRGVWSFIEKLERVASLAILILFAPLMASIAVVIVALSRRSPLVSHLRVGQLGAPLWTLKFRTMWPEHVTGFPRTGMIEYIVDESGMDYKSSYDPRV